MAQRDLKRVPVLCDGMLVGIITRADLIRLLARK
jgi:CBS domain-containing protein